jgi:hypothetical protein
MEAINKPLLAPDQGPSLMTSPNNSYEIASLRLPQAASGLVCLAEAGAFPSP